MLNRVIHEVKHMKSWVSSKPRVYDYEHKVTRDFLMLKLPYTKRGVGLLKTILIACPTRMD